MTGQSQPRRRHGRDKRCQVPFWRRTIICDTFVRECARRRSPHAVRRNGRVRHLYGSLASPASHLSLVLHCPKQSYESQDAQNRQISMQMMMEIAEDTENRQFIFITPQDIRFALFLLLLLEALLNILPSMSPL